MHMNVESSFDFNVAEKNRTFGAEQNPLLVLALAYISAFL